jgi:tetratricopeptide (TPR) repeat protein
MEWRHEVRVTRDALVRDGWKPAAFTTFILMLMLVLAGCAHQKAYKRGDRLSREGQYDRAIQELEKAIRLAEDDDNRKAAQKYREKLSQVRVQAGQFFHREAELRFGRAELGEARDSIVRALSFCPQEPTYESFRQRVLQAITEAEKVRADALSLAEQRQWPAAIQRMNEALAMYRTLPGGEGDLKHIRERAYQYHVDRANDRLREGNLAEAESEAQTAMTYLAGSEAKAVIQTVKDRREAAELIARGRALLDQGDPEGALAALERAAKLHPSHPDLADLLGRAKHAVCDRWLDQGRTALAAHNYPAAMRLFQKSRNLLDGYGGVNTLLADARSALAELHLKASRQFLLGEAAGSAAFHAAAALSYLPERSDARNLLGQCIEQIRQDVSYVVAFAGFKATPAQLSPAAVLDAAALEHLARSHPPNVTVAQRPDLQTVFGERDLNAVQQIDPQSGALQGIDALIVGQVLSAKVTSESKRSGYAESIYQDGYRPEPNPEHGQAAAALHAAMEQLEHARIRLSEAEDRLSHFRYVDPHNPREMEAYRRARAQVDEARHHLEAAAAEVGVAKVRLAATPREVLVPNMVKHQYPIETFTWTARITCLIKMLDTTTGEVFIAQRADGQAEQSDTMVQADAYRNVPEDPLVLPSEFGLLEAAANAAIAKLKPTLSQACTKHGQRFLLTMQRADASGDTIRAVDNGVKYLFAYPAGDGQTGAIVSSLRKYLADEDGLIDVRAMLRTHCHVLQ